jgi:hypothetical protein
MTATLLLLVACREPLQVRFAWPAPARATVRMSGHGDFVEQPRWESKATATWTVTRDGLDHQIEIAADDPSASISFRFRVGADDSAVEITHDAPWVPAWGLELTSDYTVGSIRQLWWRLLALWSPHRLPVDEVIEVACRLPIGPSEQVDGIARLWNRGSRASPLNSVLLVAEIEIDARTWVQGLAQMARQHGVEPLAGALEESARTPGVEVLERLELVMDRTTGRPWALDTTVTVTAPQDGRQKRLCGWRTVVDFSWQPSN